jgi:hypothetical protein
VTLIQRPYVYYVNQQPSDNPVGQSNPSPKSIARPDPLMEGVYNADGPQETRGLGGARETRDIHLGTISTKLKASIHRSYPADPPIWRSRVGDVKERRTACD